MNRRACLLATGQNGMKVSSQVSSDMSINRNRARRINCLLFMKFQDTHCNMSDLTHREVLQNERVCLNAY
jgi:hypothetical protein